MELQQSVFIVDDDPAMRESLEFLIDSVGLKPRTFASGAAFLDRVQPDWAGCAIVDVRMPGVSGLELQERLNERNIKLPIIVVTGHADVPMAVRAMKSGALDFVQKPFNDQVMLDLVNRALEMDYQKRREMAQFEELQIFYDRLTPREREVMEHVVAGYSNKQVAAALGLSEKTIEVHRSRVMAKMECDSVAELVQMAMELRARENGSEGSSS